MMRFIAVLLLLAISLYGQTSSTKASTPLATGIARNQQELQQLSTLIGQNNADMRAIVKDVLISLAGAVAGAGPESAFGQGPRETLANLISAYQKVQGALETGQSALDGDGWLTLSGQLKLTLDLIGETELPVRLANTMTDLLVKTAQLVSLARQNANLVAVKVQVAQAQTYLLAKAAAIQASRTAAQRAASQQTVLPRIKADAQNQSEWLLQQYKDKPQVIQLAVKNTTTARTASQIVSGLQAATANTDAMNLSKIPGINPDAIAAMIRCNQIALTMVQRQESLSAILRTCPKPSKQGADPPPCPVYETAAIQNDSINRSSMTCNKDASGGYIPFFSAPQPQGPAGSIAGSWRLLPGSYYGGWRDDAPEKRLQNRRANVGYLYDIRQSGPGHFETVVQVGSKTYPIELNGSDTNASGDRDVVFENPFGPGSSDTYSFHVEAQLSNGQMTYTEMMKRAARNTDGKGRVEISYQESYSLAARNK